MVRSCLWCYAVFEQKGEEDKTLERLKKHREKCTKDDPYKDDDNADYYDECID